MAKLTLVIGSKNTSSWSLRPWLALSVADVPFEEVLIPLGRPETRAALGQHAPTAKVPALRIGDVVVWESLAIIEHAAELAPSLWPADPVARAVARAAATEMHAGFSTLRSLCPMDVTGRRPAPRPLPDALAADVDRVVALWRDCRARFGAGGPFLFGGFTAVDAMYAPVVTRFVTYDLPRDAVVEAYMRAVQELPAMRAWTEAAGREVADRDAT